MENVTPNGLETNPDWSERLRGLQDIDPLFFVGINMTFDLKRHLTPEEIMRMNEKLPKVQEFAREMAFGMLKGVIKYPTDEHTPEEWRAEARAELADTVNYHILGEY